jgi:outer membrane protein TolC
MSLPRVFAALAFAGAIGAAPPAGGFASAAPTARPSAPAAPKPGPGAPADRPLALSMVLESTERHPSLEAARTDLAAARGELLASAGLFDPTLRARAANAPVGYYSQSRLDAQLEWPTSVWGATVFGGYRLGRGSFAPYDGKLETNELGEWRAGLSVPVWRNGPIDRRRAALARAEQGLTAAEGALEVERLGLYRQAVQRYWGWAAAGRRLAVAEALLGVAVRRDADLARSVSAGAVAPVERLENQRAVFQREAQLVQARQALAQAAVELSLFWRYPGHAPVVPSEAALPDALPDPVAVDAARLARDLETAVANRPELRRLEAQRAQAEIERRFAENQLAPGVDLSLVGSQDQGPGSPARAPGELEAGIGLEWPILNRQPRGRLEAAEAASARLAAQQRLQAERVRAETLTAQAELSGAVARVAIARRELATARRLEALERERFRLGESTLLIVNLREQATAETAMREIDALADAQRAQAAYHLALGLAPSAR